MKRSDCMRIPITSSRLAPANRLSAQHYKPLVKTVSMRGTIVANTDENTQDPTVTQEYFDTIKQGLAGCEILPFAERVTASR
jgi:hypothetical protein